MNSRLNSFIATILSLCLGASCTKEPQDIETVQLADDLYIEETDTIAPVYTVYRLDSFATSGSNSAIIGGVSDPYFGRIEAENFSRFKLAINHYQTVGADNEYYDSIMLVMHSDSTYYGDTMSNFNVSVYRLRQEFDASTTTYYNHHYFLSAAEVLGQTTVRFRPQVDDSIQIRLDDNFGRELFEMYRSDDARVQTQDAFQHYLRGLRITGSSSNNSIYRFPSGDSTLYFRLYYHADQGDGVPKYLDFPAEGGSYQFNHITCDVNSTELASLLPGAEIRSEHLNNRFYLNDLAGIGTKITFPSAPAVATLPNFIRLSDAVLAIRPIPGSYDKFPLIPSLGMNLHNEETQNAGPLYSSDNTYIQNGNLSVDPLNTVTTGYSYDVSAIMRNELSATVFTTITASLQPNSNAGSGVFSMQRLVAADNRHTKLPSTLTTQLIFYKK